MRVLCRILVNLAAFFLAGSMVPNANAADPPPSKCSHRDINFGQGEFICVAPGYAQICDNNSWKAPEKSTPYNDICAKFQVFVSPSQCIYHDVKYTTGSIICVGPNFSIGCTENGIWALDQDTLKRSKEDAACKNAQIPTPTYPAAPSTSSATK
jgi:hypothetical protein